MISIKLKLFLLTTIAITLTPALALPWLPSGIGGGGGFEQPSISPHNSNIVYMSSDMSGVYKTTDFGQKWDLLPYRTSGQNGINDRGRTSPFQFTNNPSIIYATNRDSYPAQAPDTDAPQTVYPVKSTDGGNTFSKIADFGLKVFADPSNANRVLIQGAGVIKYSSNGGSTFTNINQLGMPGYVNNVLHVSGVHWNGSSVVVATNFGLREFNPNASPLQFYNRGNTGIFSHVNGNASIGNSIATFSSVKVGANSATFYAVTYPTSLAWNISYPRNASAHSANQVKVYKMNWVQGSAANNWVPNAQWNLVNSYPSNFIPYWVKTSQANSSIVYLAGIDKTPWDRPSVMRSWNSGSGWTSIFRTDKDNCGYAPCSTSNVNIGIEPGWAAAGASPNVNQIAGIDWGWSPNIEGIAVDPNNSERVVITSNSVHVTENASSKNWRQAYNKQETPNQANAPIPQHNSTKRYSTNGIEPTMTYWLTWTRSKLLAAMTDISGMFSDNNGSSWRNIANNITLARNQADTNKVAHLNTYKITKSKLSGKRLYAGMSTINDIYQAHSRLTDFESAFNSSNCFSNNKVGAIGSIHKSNDDGQSWQPVKWFKCPVVWVETDLETVNGVVTEVLYASVIHKVHGGIFKVTSPNSSNTVVTRLPSNPSTVQGNPHNIYALKGSNGATELLTTWSVKRTSANGSFVGSGLFKYANNQWQSYGQPPAMDKHTRNVVIDPKNNSIWYVGAFNKYNRFKPSSSNSIYNGTGGGGGIFRFTNNGANWTRITPDSIYRAESIAINPDLFTSEAYVTTANDGIWKTDNVYASSPTFTRVIDFPYSRALRVFYAPDKSVWATTVGGGLFKLDDGRSKIGTVVTVPAGTGSALPITDNSLNPQNHWSNGGDASKRYIDLNLQERHSITNIVYADVWSRQLKISIYDGGATTVVFVSTNPKVNGLSKTNIPIDNILGDRVRIEVTNGNYMQTIEAEVHGAMIEADFTSIQTTPTANQSNIDDGNWTTTWNNGGNPSNAFIGLVLDKKRTVFNVQYTDRWQRKLKIQFYSEGKIVHELTTDTNNANGNPVTTNITVPDIPAGFISIREVGVPNQGVRWMTPTEIDVFGWPE